MPVFQEGIGVKMKSECGGTSGRDNSFCDICEGFLPGSDTPPKKQKKRKRNEKQSKTLIYVQVCALING